MSAPSTPPTVDPALLAQLQAFVGAGADRPGFAARHPVSHAVIGQMIDAVGDRNPIYSDEEFARGSVHGGIVAPPLWLYSWMMPGLPAEAEQPRLADGTAAFHLAPSGQRRAIGLGAAKTTRDELNEVLEAHGFVVPAVTNMTYTYHRYLRVGERPRFSSWIIDSVTGPKQTKLGLGFFAAMHIDVFVGEEKVATIAQVYLRSKPDSSADKPADQPAAPATSDLPQAQALEQPVFSYGPPQGRTTETLRFDAVKVGDTLPALAVKISPTLIIAGALASQDFQDVHHDFGIIRERGHPNIFMNMMTTSGLLGRYVTDWTGPNAIMRSHVLRLLRPNYPGDVMRIAGTVKRAEIVDGHGMVELDLIGTNSLGVHTNSNVTVELPLG